jgi:trehalose-phosphatase
VRSEELQRAIAGRASEPLLCIVAFDGVLAPYEVHPGDVTLPPPRRERMAALMRDDECVVGIMSGRALDDLIPRVGLGPSAFYIGLHGLETLGPGLVRRSEMIGTFEALFDEIAHGVAPQVAKVEGAWLEHKGGVLALHTCGAASADAVWLRFHLLNAAAPLVNSKMVRVFRGRDVLELVPNDNDSRAAAIATVREAVVGRRGSPVFTVYIGPDVPDDEAVVAVAPPDAAITVATPYETDAVLDRLLAARFAR